MNITRESVRNEIFLVPGLNLLNQKHRRQGPAVCGVKSYRGSLCTSKLRTALQHAGSHISFFRQVKDNRGCSKDIQVFTQILNFTACLFWPWQRFRGDRNFFVLWRFNDAIMFFLPLALTLKVKWCVKNKCRKIRKIFAIQIG